MQRIFGVFSNLDDARNALGRIKKESWNRATLTIIMPFIHETNHQTDHFELSSEFFLDEPTQEAPPWPGLKQQYLEGVGVIQIGTTTKDEIRFELRTKELPVIKKEVNNQKVITIIDCESELIPKVQLILESKGAEILEDQA